jgi:hypothetical protein
MDPNAALKEIREIVKDPDSNLDSGRVGTLSRLIDLIDGLDGWISKGGFLPRDWQKLAKNAQIL